MTSSTTVAGHEGIDSVVSGARRMTRSFSRGEKIGLDPAFRSLRESQPVPGAVVVENLDERARVNSGDDVSALTFPSVNTNAFSGDLGETATDLVG